MEQAPRALVEVTSLTEFFRDSLHAAIERQRFSVDEHTERYVVGVLEGFARSEALFEATPEGVRLRPLALMLADALHSARRDEQAAGLQRMGDVALFVAGFFARGFARRLVDVDYHIAMGGRAYSGVAGLLRGTARGRALGAVFEELSAKFQRLVDALNDVADSGYRYGEGDIMRLYEIWLRTGSPRARALLAGLGVQPVSAHADARH